MSEPVTCNCGQPAREWVTYRSQRTGKQVGEPVAMCAEHVQQEFTLAARNLTMVDIDLTHIGPTLWDLIDAERRAEKQRAEQEEQHG